MSLESTLLQKVCANVYLCRCDGVHLFSHLRATLRMLMLAVAHATEKPPLPVFSPRPGSVPHSEGKNSTLLHIDSLLCSRV